MRLTDKKRAAILAAAVAEFQQHGFDGTSMDRIAAVAEVSKRTVYNHFASKEDLFAAIVSELLARSQTMSDYVYMPELPLAEQLFDIGKAIAQTLTSDDFMQLSRAIVSRFLQSPDIAESTFREHDKFNSGLIAWIEAASQDNRLAITNAEFAATQFTSLIKAFVFWPQLIGNQAPVSEEECDRIIQSAVALFLSYYSAIGEAREGK
ncbi:TetR/AcrR family transcriptional regulator [Roseofilum casamattae]|uniref:TetR/AcrR family transcriptional regulator n=1 Tax=Roseofilum casamattae BLCC-M143 TaxID=3022442 RepID=A0ABT7BWY2_9CYAN|nr:TetR/AcrR family transcriptional regulator [Roseofilum casamattae]MDJ1183676.1 TetR/AcrR family transcriptional regulator [Roseofilum casamattae BLCC-M143]